jgi:hypothetical protein
MQRLLHWPQDCLGHLLKTFCPFQGLGPTVEPLRSVLGVPAIPKTHFTMILPEIEVAREL